MLSLSGCNYQECKKKTNEVIPKYLAFEKHRHEKN
jgi:hypothetical protein